MTLRWQAVNPLDGSTLAYVPTFAPDWPLRRSIGAAETATGTLLLAGAPVNWERATLPFGALLAVFEETDPARTPLWVGLIHGRDRTTGSGKAKLSLATAEYYLGRCPQLVDIEYDQVGQNAIVADLVARFAAFPGAMPIQVAYTTPGDDGTPRSFAWPASDRATVLQRLQTLTDLEGGPEWTVEWARDPNSKRLAPTLRVGDRIGSAAPAGLAPQAAFRMPGNLITAQLVEDYGDGFGANRVTAFGVGEGNATPSSGPQDAADTGGRLIAAAAVDAPAWIDNQADLVAFAVSTVARLAPGATTLTLTASVSAAPQLGSVWHVGDDVQADIAPCLEFPLGLTRVGRSVGAQLGKTTISPILAQPVSA